MAKQSNKVRWIVGLGIVLLVAVLVYSTFQQTRTAYEVCVTFKGGSHCANAAGANYDQAVRSATEIDCQLLAHDRNETMVCLDTQPSSVRELNK